MMSSATTNSSKMPAATATNSVLSAFGLEDQEAALARAFCATGAAIHGGAALSWYLNTSPPPGQDIDIWCQPTESILRPVIYALYDNIFRAACYRPVRSYARDVKRARYYKARELHIDAIHEWEHMGLDRTIQLIFRATHSRLGIAIPKSPTDGFDLDITAVKVSASLLNTSPTRLALEPIHADLADRIKRRVMRISNLKGQQLSNNIRRVRKYYERGFAFETTDATCSCTCGAIHHTIATPPRRLTLEEAEKMVGKEWVAANPLPDSNPFRADNFYAYLHSMKSLDEMDRDLLADIIHGGSQATILTQNLVNYPTETAWINKYLGAAVFVSRFRRIQRTWNTCCPTKRYTIDIAPILRQLRVIQESPYPKDFPAIAEEINRLLKEIHDWQAGILIMDYVPKKVVKRVLPETDVIEARIPATMSQELTRAVTDATATPAAAATKTDKITHA